MSTIFESESFSHGEMSADMVYQSFLSELIEINPLSADMVIEQYGQLPDADMIDEALQFLFSELIESAPIGYTYHVTAGPIADVWESREFADAEL